MDEIVIETFFLFHIFSYTGKARFLIQAFFFFFFGTTRYVPNYVPPLPYRGRYHQREKKREKEREREKKRKQREREKREVCGKAATNSTKTQSPLNPIPGFAIAAVATPLVRPIQPTFFFPLPTP